MVWRGDFFGTSISLSGDGNTAIIGAIGDDVGANSSQGTARVLFRTGSVWTEHNNSSLSEARRATISVALYR